MRTVLRQRGAVTLGKVGPWAVEYEECLRKEDYLDFDDAIRIGTLLLQHPGVSEAYKQRFPVVMVNEVQDLSEAHLEMLNGIDTGQTIFAGDQAQGIFRFAGAETDAVYKHIEAQVTFKIHLITSYRSAPAILKVVSWSSTELDGDKLVSAPGPASGKKWTTAGKVAIHESSHVCEEAEWVLEQVAGWRKSEPECPIAVLVRTNNRRRFIDLLVKKRKIAAEFWDLPTYKPKIVSLLKRFAPLLIQEHSDDRDALEALTLRCAENISIEDAETKSELLDAVEDLQDPVAKNGLEASLNDIRTVSDPNLPTPPGLHLLNGHLGKGQQFDKVIVIGLEEGHIPDFRATTNQELQEELSVLHVMMSRACDTLIFTRSEDVPNPKNGNPWPREESRWLPALRQLTTE